MKKLSLITLLSIVAFSLCAQTPAVNVKYRRSSLFTLMVADSVYPHSATIQDAFLKYPMPDKFNDHNLKDKLISGKAVAKDQLVIIANYLEKNTVAKDLVAKWFNRNASGAFNMELIGTRGSYNASEMEADIAKKTARGTASLADAGEELIGNTFVLVSDFKYMPDSLYFAKAEKVTNSLSKIGGGIGAGVKIGGVNVNVGKTINTASKIFKGYVVVAKSYLFRLNWSDSVAAVFYNDYWIDSLHIDAGKKAAFDSSAIFKMDYVGTDEAIAWVQTTKLSHKSEDTLVAYATVNAVDAVIVKLQKKHEEFRTKTPLYSIDPLAAKIGLKEGLDGGDRYEVLEQNEKDGRTFYDKVGSITVDGKHIWDNRYMAEADSANVFDRTWFKGGTKKMYEGMLIKQK